MRKLLTLVLLVVALITGAAQAQTNTPRWYFAATYNGWAINGQAPNTYTFTSPSICQIPNPTNSSFYTFNTNAPVLINDLGTPSNSEVVTPATVSQNPCGFTGTFAHSHYSFQLQSGTAGLQEAINAAVGSTANAGTIILDSIWWGSANGITGTNGATIIGAAAGSAKVNLLDTTADPWVIYAWNGSAYVGTTQTGPSGSSWTRFVTSELVTLSTSGTTTDTTGNLLPANSFIDMVQGVVNTTITSACTGWQLGDATTAGRFTASDTTLTAGEAKNGIVMATTGIASATTGMWQASAAKVRITCATGNPGAGKVRVVVYGRTFVTPGS